MTSDTENRRGFFRIVDSIGVAYRVISDKEQNLAKQSQQEVEGHFIDTYSLMNNYNKVILQSVDDLKARDPQAATAIEQLNKKVDAILMMLELDSLMTHRLDHRVEQASISASGIAFSVEEQLPLKTSLALDLLLKPSSQHITAAGEVISCESLKGGNYYYLRVAFTEMDKHRKEKLIQHIVQRQGSLLRALKSEVDDL